MKRLIVTIDGPSGAGKTTVGRRLATRLGFRYIDTGALYRGVAFEIRSREISDPDDEQLQQLCGTLKLTFAPTDSGMRLMSDGVDITDCIRTPEITMTASAVSAREPVRRCLFDVQRKLGRERNIVIEGRDMGTVVFPEADVKFFLDAAPETRAMRRFAEMQKISDQTLEAIENDMRIRDFNDSSRRLAPLRPADEAIIVDATRLSIDAVVDRMFHHVDQARRR